MQKEDPIVTLIREGRREEAFRKVYEHFPMIRRMVLQSGGSQDQAKDIFQDAVIVLYRMLQNTERTMTASSSTLLYSIARNQWYKKLRDNKEFHRSDEVWQEVEDLREEDAEEEEKMQPAFMAEQVFNGLGDPCATLLKMFYYENRTMEYIAGVLNYSSDKTAKAQKYKCMERAKKILARLNISFIKVNA